MSVRCKNYVVRSESTFAVKMVLSAAKQFSVPNCVGYSESVFTFKIVFPTAKQCLLPKVCCLQGISVRCQNGVVSNESDFTVKIVLSATK
jgi:hypothetical protein